MDEELETSLEDLMRRLVNRSIRWRKGWQTLQEIREKHWVNEVWGLLRSSDNKDIVQINLFSRRRWLAYWLCLTSRVDWKVYRLVPDKELVDTERLHSMLGLAEVQEDG